MQVRFVAAPWAVVLVCSAVICGAEPAANQRFDELAERFRDQAAALTPVASTRLGDHRFDGALDDYSQIGRNRSVRFAERMIGDLKSIDRTGLSRDRQVDLALLRHELDRRIWEIQSLQQWAWNPLEATALAGSAIYNLLARDFAPEPERLQHVAERLEAFPRFFDQVRAGLDPARVPRVHAETAVSQNRGLHRMLSERIEPRVTSLDADGQKRLRHAIRIASAAIEEQQRWLEQTVVPRAKGDFRLGARLYDRKLAFTLFSPLSRSEIERRASERVVQLHQQMYEIACTIYRQHFPLTKFPDRPSDAYRRAIIRAGLERACAEVPPADEVVPAARIALKRAREFVEQKQLVTLFPDPLDIIVMPEFEQGVTLAYCDAPGPLDVGQKTFYAVSPIPADWTNDQTRSFLREYNTRSLHVLTMHEAMPGHYVQLSHSNRAHGTIRQILQSGVFIEGWAEYSEWMMCEAGFLNNDPLLKLVTLKWYLRQTTNAILDSAVHTRDMSREEALRLLVEDAFQEEREAVAKWKRAQLTSAQMCEYFVGYTEVSRIRREAESRLGDRFDLRTFHDRLLRHGSPPPQFVRALLFDLPISTGEPALNTRRP